MEEINNKPCSSSFSSTATSNGRGRFVKTTASRPCPICSKWGWCRLTEDLTKALCQHVEQGCSKSKIDRNGTPYYVHRLDGSVDLPSPRPPMPATAPVDRAGEELLNQVYEALLAALPLSLAHRDNLRQRGMPDLEIDQRRYGSHIGKGRARVARALHERFGDDVLRVPGFFVKAGDNGRYLTLAGRPGMLIPVRNMAGQIVALRIRRDDAELQPGDSKYHWLSSAASGGAGPGAPIHVPKTIAADVKRVRITEGELKADIATSRSGLLTLSLPGVSIWRALPETLKALKCEIVRLAIDMDAREKPQVAKALDELAYGLVEAGFTLELETWPAEFKGIDDALAAGAAIEVIEPDKARFAIAEIVSAGAGDGGPPKIGQGDAYEGDDDDRNEVYLPEWKPFPVEALPATIRNFSLEYGRSLEADPSILALFALSTIAGCIGRSRIIRLRPSWWEPCAIFGCVIGVSCSKKSAALREAIAPAELFDDELYKKSAANFQAFDEAMDRYANWKQEGKGAEKPSRPIEPNDEQLIAQDITIEDVIKRMKQNPRGLFFPFEELRMWFLSMGRYKSSGGGVEECIWLNIFDGINFHFSRSKHRQRIRNRVLGSVIGGTQPKVWTEVASAMAFGTGMMGRVLPIWPDKVPQTGHYVPPSLEATRAYHELVRSAALLDREGTSQADWSPVEMILSGPAQNLWQSWEKKWGDRIDAADGEVHTLLARMKTYCARFALIGSVCDQISGFDGMNMGPSVVDADHIRNAITLCEWFAEEAERIYFRGRLDPNEIKRDEILQKMRDRHGPNIPRPQWYSLTKRELWASNRGKWKNSQAAELELEKLTRSPDGKNPGQVIRVGRRYFLRDKR